ncbi:hypothetical protein KPL31_11510 [Clostridium algidicarnis]|nr:hypothetical protein [Clostridium algidicarnis]MBU3209044.1 hypothetical protein [Clostridium algidicarnis]MBU3228766.1 hypothetical protein [Clostridium algidicarnis]MBU3252310.1 hypothetical protein [Clostridium algidicarnis]
MFGVAQSEGDLNGNGRPRCKQRAFYDFIKDILYITTGILVVIYDVFDYDDREYTLGDVLKYKFIVNDDIVDRI